jgi:prolyl-tRNA synthetase
MIRKIASGIYGFMHMGWRSVRKIEEIVRQEMDAKGAQEIHMPAILPSELWKESGRWYVMGPEMWRVNDRRGREFCLGPTHEEVLTDIVRNEISSYRQLPMNLYQIQMKYRDEARPRFGLMRAREFIMKDAYTFDRDREGMERSYADMFDAYNRVFSRCGLSFRALEADSGTMGGNASHEFQAFAENGEGEMAYCEACGMAATTERSRTADAPPSDETTLPAKTKHTPGVKTIEDVSRYLGLTPDKTIKALLFTVYGEDYVSYEYVIAFIRGDRELNMTKLINYLGVPEHAVVFADETDIAAETGCVGGFTGPMGLRNCKVIVDSELPGQRNMCAGANEPDRHVINVNFGRDYTAEHVTDLKLIREGDPCPVCGAPVKLARGIEVGQIYQLGTRYSDSMGAYYKDENMRDLPIFMGSHGIGVTRALAAVVEQYHDEDGIVWPVQVAPYHVIVTVVKHGDAAQTALAERIYAALAEAGAEVLLDDRDERAGVKFKDADLFGIPVRITVGKKAAADVVEYKLRRERDAVEKSSADAVQDALRLIEAERFGPVSDGPRTAGGA